MVASYSLGLIGYILYPTAPPRMLPELGFIDTLATADVNQQGTGRGAALEPLRGDAEPAHRDRDPDRHPRLARGPQPARSRAVGRSIRALVVFSIVATAITSSSTPWPERCVLGLAFVIVIALHRRRVVEARLRRADRSSAATDRSSKRRGRKSPGRPSLAPVKTLPLRLNRIKNGYTDGARSLATSRARAARTARSRPTSSRRSASR